MDFDNNLPIYIQLEDKLKINIITGYYKSGEKLPSVRELSTITKVNPNTVQRALNELEKDNIIYTQRTSGKYVTKKIDTIKKLKENYAKNKINLFIESMKELNLSKEDVIKIIKESEKN